MVDDILEGVTGAVGAARDGMAGSMPSGDLRATVTLEPPAGLQQVNAEGKAMLGYAPEDLVPAQLLDGGEVVILAIKPSLWFILFNSFRWVAVLGLLVAVVLWYSPGIGWSPRCCFREPSDWACCGWWSPRCNGSRAYTC